jgi:hypothetical protein
MGLHRDGELLNLNPCETEMRRRVWWQIMMQDAKYAMLSGLSHSLLPWSWDTKVPSNVNDADLFPGSMERIQPRDGPTEMAFCLFSYEIGKFLVHSQGFPGFEAVVIGNEIDQLKDPGRTKDESVKKYRAMVDDLETKLRLVEEKYIDPTAGPIHKVCTQLRENIVGKIRSMLTPMREQPEWGTEVLTPKDNLFKLVVVNTEYTTSSYRIVKDAGFIWFSKLHFQVDVFLLMVGHLYTRVTGPLVDRAWKQVETVYQFHEEILDMTQKNNVILGTFVLRGWRAREVALGQLGLVPEVPSCVFKLREIVPGSESGTTDGTPPSASSDGPPATAKPQRDVQMSDPALDQFLGGYFDITALDWDMWGDMAAQGQDQVASAFGAFGAVGPSGKW